MVDLREEHRGVRAFGRKGSSRKRPAVVECDAALTARCVDAQNRPVIWVRRRCAGHSSPVFEGRFQSVQIRTLDSASGNLGWRSRPKSSILTPDQFCETGEVHHNADATCWRKESPLAGNATA